MQQRNQKLFRTQYEGLQEIIVMSPLFDEMI